MKICILTQPLHNNYGGLLQAYAMQAILKKMGHDPWTVDIWQVGRKKGIPHYYRSIQSRLTQIFMRYLYRKPVALNLLTNRIRSQHTRRFIDENIRITEKITDTSKLSLLKKYNFDAYIVGSDQVWRPIYSPGLPHFFLNFLDDNSPVKRIAYAASFGVENWEYTPEQTELCSALAKKFDAISVREDSGVDLCKKNFNVDAKLVLDPTLLLEVEDYVTLVEHDNIPKSEGDLLIYVIDQSPEKQKIINIVAEGLGLKPFFGNKLADTEINIITEGIFPPVTQWVRGFVDAGFVITDSYHGTLFSLIFNKPFIVIGNDKRGIARFNSILKIFKLENRIISTSQQITEELLNKKINWIDINAVIAEMKTDALHFLKKGLENDIN